MSALLEAAQDARHDLGKYICMNQRWLGPDASPTDALQALQADLLRTQSGPSGVRSAFELWATLRPALEGAGPEIDEIDGALSRLSSHRSAVESGTLAQDTLADCAADCIVISQALKTLTRRLQKES